MDFVNVILTALLSVLTLFIIAKIMGHKQVAQLDFFDYITGITIGSIAAELATELETPWKPLTAMLIYGFTAFLLSVMTNKFPRLRKYVNGTPTIIMHDGKLYRENMKKAKLDLSEFMVMCRQAGYFNLNNIQTAVFEYNGKLSIMPVSDQRPVTPSDMSMKPEKEHIYTEIIMDGRLLEENIKRANLETEWLLSQLKAKGYNSPKEVYLGLCDDKKNLTLFSGE
ncbi:MAG: YetF domain-containing protein [Oscillospiraceae bacterium]